LLPDHELPHGLDVMIDVGALTATGPLRVDTMSPYVTATPRTVGARSGISALRERTVTIRRAPIVAEA